MNDLDLLGDRLWLREPLRHVRYWISWKSLEIETWFQRTTNRKWPTGESNGHVNDDVTWRRNYVKLVTKYT